jgi:cystathionine beta-lyase
MTDQELRNFLINEAGVGFNDGFMFGPGGEGFQRINFACPQQLVLEAFDKVEVALKKKGIL